MNLSEKYPHIGGLLMWGAQTCIILGISILANHYVARERYQAGFIAGSLSMANSAVCIAKYVREPKAEIDKICGTMLAEPLPKH